MERFNPDKSWICSLIAPDTAAIFCFGQWLPIVTVSKGLVTAQHHEQNAGAERTSAH